MNAADSVLLFEQRLAPEPKDVKSGRIVLDGTEDTKRAPPAHEAADIALDPFNGTDALDLPSYPHAMKHGLDHGGRLIPGTPVLLELKLFTTLRYLNQVLHEAPRHRPPPPKRDLAGCAMSPVHRALRKVMQLPRRPTLPPLKRHDGRVHIAAPRALYRQRGLEVPLLDVSADLALYPNHVAHAVHLGDVPFHIALVLVLFSKASKKHEGRKVVLLDIPVQLKLERRHELLVVVAPDSQHDTVGQVSAPQTLNLDWRREPCLQKLAPREELCVGACAACVPAHNALHNARRNDPTKERPAREDHFDSRLNENGASAHLQEALPNGPHAHEPLDVDRGTSQNEPPPAHRHATPLGLQFDRSLPRCTLVLADPWHHLHR
mmetsp:Transcript_42640/g.114091  ORF Transcript_42640/g.114091 Transcript_42640/m.114091 type:complete len:377 (-) Transcript_42640:2125-3255(-)